MSHDNLPLVNRCISVIFAFSNLFGWAMLLFQISHGVLPTALFLAEGLSGRALWSLPPFVVSFLAFFSPLFFGADNGLSGELFSPPVVLDFDILWGDAYLPLWVNTRSFCLSLTLCCLLSSNV